MIINKRDISFPFLKSILYSELDFWNSYGFHKGYFEYVETFFDQLELFLYVCPLPPYGEAFEINVNDVTKFSIEEMSKNVVHDKEFWIGQDQAILDCEHLIRFAYDVFPKNQAA